jgi:hypothetical protein
METGTSLVLIAIGAILRFAVTATVSGVSIHTIGTILIIIGIVGLLFSLLFLASWRERRVGPAVVERPVVRDPVYRDRI